MADNTGKTIDEVTPDTSVGGAEKIPVSDNGTAKSVTTAKIREYVLDGLKALTENQEITIGENGDDFYVWRNVGTGGTNVRVPATVVCDAVYAYLFDKQAVSTFTISDIIAVENGGTAKTTTLGALCAYVATQVNPTFDVHALDAGSAFDDTNEMAVAQSYNSVWSTVKKTLSDLATYIIGKIEAIAESTAAIGSDDYMLIVTNNNLKRVTRANAGFGSGDVTGPADAVANGIPQWNANNSKVLKAGLSVTNTVASTSQSTEIPTASAVYASVNAVGANKVIAPASNTDAKIPQWDGANSKTLKDGLALSTNIDIGYDSDTTVYSSKCVNDRMLELHDSAKKVLDFRLTTLGIDAYLETLDPEDIEQGQIMLVRYDRGTSSGHYALCIACDLTTPGLTSRWIKILLTST